MERSVSKQTRTQTFLDEPRIRRNPNLKLVENLEQQPTTMKCQTHSILAGKAAQAPSMSEMERSAPQYCGKRIGPFRIERELGRGGMGAVFLATRDDDAFKMKVAVKLINQGWHNSEIVKRFQHERQILADLKHPNIARLIDGGTTDDGLPYLVMEYVEGSPIDTYCDDHQLSIKERLAIYLKVCDAVAFTHRQGIIHRDLKPDNIMVTEEGNPVLLDFGIAKILDVAPREKMTCTGVFPMTPEYASPEQVMGETPTAASDIYALGVLLYELMTGSRPYSFSNYSIGEIRHVVCEEEPAKPSHIARSMTIGGTDPGKKTGESRMSPARLLAGDLDAVVLKALRKEQKHRYDSIEALSEDLNRYLSGFPVSARGADWRYRTSKLLHRHKWKFIALTGIGALSLTFLVMACCWQMEMDQQAREAEAQRVAASLAMAKTKQTLAAMAKERDQALLVESEKAQVEEAYAGAQKSLQELENERRKIHEELQKEQRAREQAELEKERIALAKKAEAEKELALLAAERDKALKEAEARDKALQDMEKERVALLEKQKEAVAASAKAAPEKVPTEQLVSAIQTAAAVPSDGKREDSPAALLEEIVLGAGDGAATVQSIADGTADYGDGEDAKRMRARLMNLAGVTYLSLGRYTEAAPLLEKSLDLTREVNGSEHQSVAEGLDNLGYLNYLQGHDDTAEALYKQALNIRHRRFGMKHETVAASMNLLGMLRENQGNFSEAWDMLKKSLSMRREMMGETDPSVAESLSSLSGLFWTIGNKENAVKMQQLGLKLFRDAYGDNSYEATTSMKRLEVFCCKTETEASPVPLLPLAMRRGFSDHSAGVNGLNLEQSSSLLSAFGDTPGIKPPPPPELSAYAAGGGAPPPNDRPPNANQPRDGRHDNQNHKPPRDRPRNNGDRGGKGDRQAKAGSRGYNPFDSAGQGGGFPGGPQSQMKGGSPFGGGPGGGGPAGGGGRGGGGRGGSGGGGKR